MEIFLTPSLLLVFLLPVFIYPYFLWEILSDISSFRDLFLFFDLLDSNKWIVRARYLRLHLSFLSGVLLLYMEASFPSPQKKLKKSRATLI